MHGGWSCRDVVWANENRGLGGQKVKQGDQGKELLSGLVVEGLSSVGCVLGGRVSSCHISVGARRQKAVDERWHRP